MLVFFFITPQSAKKVMCMFFFIASEFHELYVIKISLIINVYDCGTVSGNGLLLNRLWCGKALIVFSLSVCRCAGRAVFGLCIIFHQRILIIICVFKPMNNGILRVVAGRPMCSNRSTFGNRCYFLIVDIPTVKRIAAAGRHLRKRQCFARFAEYGLNIAAAVSIELDPEAAFDNRVSPCDDFVFCKRNRSGFTVRHCAPTNNVTFGIQHKVHCVFCRFQIRRADSSLRFALSRIANRRTVLVHEVHIANILKLRRKFYGRTAGYGSNFTKTFKEIVAFIVPPNKACVFLCRCRRLEELFAFGDGLLPLGQLRIAVIKAIGIDLGLLVVRKQHSRCNARFLALFRRCSFFCTCGGGRLCFHFSRNRGLCRGGSGCLLRSGSGCLLRSCGLLGRGRLFNDRRFPLHNIPCCSVGVRFLITHCKRARRTCRNQHTCAQQHGDDLLFHSVFLQSCDLSVL